MNMQHFLVISTLALGLQTLNASNARYQIVSSDEQKRSAALTTALDDLTMLPKELINIINEYDQIKVTSKVVVQTNAPIITLLALPDGRIVSAGKPKGSIQIWNQDGSLAQELIGHTATVRSLLFVAPYGLVSGSQDARVKLWDIDSGQCIKTFATTNQVTSLVRLSEHTIAAGNTGDAIYIWDLQTQQKVKGFVADPKHWWSLDQIHEIYALAYLPQHDCIVSAGYYGYIKVWDRGYSGKPITFNSGLIKTISDISWLNHDFVNALVALPDESIVSAWSNGAIKIFDPVTGKRTALLEGHAEEVNALLLMSPTMLVSASEDKTIKVWDLSKKKDQCIVTLFGQTQPVTSLAKVDDKTFISGSKYGLICKWTIAGR